ncbi:MAG: alpha/beta hydrolase [Planctomycetaceae bacterium]|nr:alpha/beta hydrolase [Planctomycetaceae bacterium]
MPSIRSRFIRQFVRLRIKHLLLPGVPVSKVRGRTNYLASYGWYPFLVKRERFQIGDIPVAAYSPKGIEPRGTILFLHGGGFCFGSIKMYADLAARLAAAAQARVVLPEYRLAPEHQYPAAHDDCLRMYEHVVDEITSAPTPGLLPAMSSQRRAAATERGEGGRRPDEGTEARPDSCGRYLNRFAVMGDSAGGGLALATAIQARDSGLPLPAALAVISPWADLTCSGPTYESRRDRDPMLPTEVMSRCAEQYAGGADVRDPRLSPLYADLSGLPPLLIQVGTEEILNSDATRLAEAAGAAGLNVTFREYDGMWHVWQLFAWAVPEGKQAIVELGEFARQQWT